MPLVNRLMIQQRERERGGEEKCQSGNVTSQVTVPLPTPCFDLYDTRHTTRHTTRDSKVTRWLEGKGVIDNRRDIRCSTKRVGDKTVPV